MNVGNFQKPFILWILIRVYGRNVMQKKPFWKPGEFGTLNSIYKKNIVMFIAFYPMQNGENFPPKNDINSML
jgi:hypothetical protein